MKNIKYINENLCIEVKEYFNRKKIFIQHENKYILLSNVKKIADSFWINVVYDENYIVVYSRGDMSNQIPLRIEAAYNIKNKSIVDLSNHKTRVLLEYMLIRKKGFYLAPVLQCINEHPLQIVSEDEVDDLVTYLTSGNNNITREEIIKYILGNYPELEDHMNYTDKLSVIDYRNIVEGFGTDILRFHVMPQIIDLSLAEKKRIHSIDGLDDATREVEHELGIVRKPSANVRKKRK